MREVGSPLPDGGVQARRRCLVAGPTSRRPLILARSTGSQLSRAWVTISLSSSIASTTQTTSETPNWSGGTRCAGAVEADVDLLSVLSFGHFFPSSLPSSPQQPHTFTGPPLSTTSSIRDSASGGVSDHGEEDACSEWSFVDLSGW